MAQQGPGRHELAPALRPYVVSLIGYDSDLGEPGVHIGMPSTALTVVVSVGEPLDVAWAGQPDSRRSTWSTASGLHAGPAEIRHDGRQHGVQVGLTVAGARALLGVPAATLAGELAELGDVDPALRHLSDQLSEAEPERRETLVERALLGGLSRHGAPEPRAEVGRSLARLTRGARVHDVADEVGYSRRHLTSLVRAECGVSPKEWQRVARFQHSHHLLVGAARAGRLSMADVAVDAGYADQSHLSREWGVLAGCSPTQWLRREFPFLQDQHGPDLPH